MTSLTEREKETEGLPQDKTATEKTTKPEARKISPLASVQLSVFLMTLMAATVLLGAWCPQEAQVGQDKVFQAFDRKTAEFLVRSGISDIFHSAWFLTLTAMMTVNMIVVSFQRVFPKLKNYTREMPYLGSKEIGKLSYQLNFPLKSEGVTGEVFEELTSKLKRLGYKVQRQDNRLKAEYGRMGRLAATVTHIGLLSLLAGISITNWTGFNGFRPVLLGESLTFEDAKHANWWVGKLPQWKARVDSTRRENYPTGEAKQWYSVLSVVDKDGKVLKTGEISVNNPLSYEGTDIYQSSWGLDQLVISFNGKEETLNLQSMGQKYAAFMPLDPETMMILSLSSEGKELRVFAKRKEWETPKMLGLIPLGQALSLGGVDLKFEKVLPVTGLQYKCDPGLPLTYVAFIIVMTGVLLASIPHRHLWCAIDNIQVEPRLFIGGSSRKAKVGFERSVDKLSLDLSKFKAEEKSAITGANETDV